MEDTFYNLEGLTDQKPLDAFWRDPQPSDRPSRIASTTTWCSARG